jgi:hypothetical protein
MKSILIFALCVLSFQAFSQDERYYRSLFSGKIFDIDQNDFKFKVSVESPKYMIDLDRDGIMDSIQTMKKDGVDFFRINDPHGRQIFFDKLMTKGKDSKIFKVQFTKIKDGVDALIVHFYEGDNDAAIFEGSARIYIYTILQNNLLKISKTRGPLIWMEKQRAAGKYYNRRYSVNLVDYNKDGVKEISTSFNKIHRILMYTHAGIWKNI